MPAGRDRRGFVKARVLESCLSSGQTLPESRAADRFLKADERSTLPLPEWPQPHPSPEVAADDARPRAAVTSRRHANCPLRSPFPANSGANPRLLSLRNSGVARARPSAGLHEHRSRLPCHEVLMLASPSSTPRALIVERIGRAALLVDIFRRVIRGHVDHGPHLDRCVFVYRAGRQRHACHLDSFVRR